MSPRFPCISKEGRELLLSLFPSKVAYLVQGSVLAYDGCFLFYWRLILLWVIGVGFGNTCAISGKWNISRVVPRLYGWLYKILRLPFITTEDGVMVATARYQIGVSQFNSRVWLVSNSRFTKFQLGSGALIIGGSGLVAWGRKSHSHFDSWCYSMKWGRGISPRFYLAVLV